MRVSALAGTHSGLEHSHVIAAQPATAIWFITEHLNGLKKHLQNVVDRKNRSNILELMKPRWGG